ncbi:hypothetical protein DFA_11140 [Cavenderia fasciculata]|uniref:ComC supersandwich domain-containing protein n=1 Tax=Cavenderia fasciculata TaxID=261658 RepID=F4QF20_CACFS|nr:uncharacterized protein DFA_11140 [Cavenderia fasciculata]EGG13379.1 hypothetical protein DFA_11140 [Cavenderia fasciculata]|eukprot:XP_004350083.1 hypothetical protein DFA_11140 [Cavenderia fasciculata]
MKGYLHCVLLIATLLACFYTPVVECQGLPPAEIDSVYYMIKYLGSTIPQVGTELCQQTTYIQCSTITGELHITSISIYVEVYNNVGQPNFNLQQFELPYLQSLVLVSRANQVFDSSNNLNALIHRVNTLPALVRLTIQGDVAMQSIPNDFPKLLPSLREIFLVENKKLRLVGSSFFNNTSLETIYIRTVEQNVLQDIPIGQYHRLPKLKKLVVTVSPTASSSAYLNSDTTPNLIYLDFALNSTAAYSLNFKVIRKMDQVQGSLIMVMDGPKPKDSIVNLKLIGSATLAPDNMNEYNNLKNLTYESNSLNDMPFGSGFYPPSLSILEFRSNDLVLFFQNTILPSTLSTLNIDDSKLTGSLPVNVFTNVLKNGEFNLMLNNNENLVGMVPPDLCSLRSLQIKNTGFNQVPDCFYCYSDNPTIIQMDLQIPQNFICSSTFDNPEPFYAANGLLENQSGQNLGWGNPLDNVLAVIPNKRISFFNIPLNSTSLTFDLNPSSSVSNVHTISIVDATVQFIISNGEVDISSKYIGSPSPAYLAINISMDYVNPSLTHVVKFGVIPSTIDCINVRVTYTQVSCQIFTKIDAGTYMVYIQNPYAITGKNLKLAIGAPYNYPVVSSAQLSTNASQLELFGYFGETPALAEISFNQTIGCNSYHINSSYLSCTIDPTKFQTPGPISLSVTVDSSNVILNNLLYIQYPPSINLKQKCIDETQNCYGHGECNDQGICICQQGYQDNCKLKVEPNVTFVKNETQPTATFQLNDDYKFEFSMVSIEEIDSDNNIVSQLITNNWTVSYDNSTTSVDRLVYTLSPSLLQPSVTIQTTIEFSNISRSVLFGDTLLNVSANSIKIGVNVTNWNFQSFLTHLRIVFSTTLDADQQSFVENCQETQIPIFSDDEASTESYLRVIKGSTQFYGRFLSYSYSNGRKTFTKNEFINQTRIVGQEQDGNLYTAYIGIHVPQCSSCLLDPDFSALVSPKKENTGQCDEEDNSMVWKIAVGASVGGAVFIALVIATVLFLKDSNSFRIRVNAAKSIMMRKKKGVELD